MTGSQKNCIAAALLLSAALLISSGLYTKSKALVAQYLLERAWDESLKGDGQIKPWPWADSYPVARLTVPRLGVDLIVLEGDSGEVLAFAPGHLGQSAAPEEWGNCVLLGHRDTVFAFLQDLRKGDVLNLYSSGGKMRQYQVVGTSVEKKDNLFIQETLAPWLTLVTCYPFDALTAGQDLRYIVFARALRA